MRRVGRRVRLVACAAGLALGATACAQILGLQDRTLDSDASADSGGVGTSTWTSTSTSSMSTMDDGAVQDSTTSDGSSTSDGGAGGDATSAVDAPHDGMSVVPDAARDGMTGDGGCTNTAPCELASGLDWPFAPAADQTHVYWSEAPVLDTGSVKSCPQTGCPVLPDGGGGPLVYVSGLQLSPGPVAIDAQNIYWATYWTTTNTVVGGIWSCPLAGCGAGGPRSLGTPYGASGIAVDSTYLYWVSQINTSIHRIPKNTLDGGGDQVLYAGPTSSSDPLYFVSAGQVAIDATSVFFVDTSGGGVWRAPITGGAPVLVINDSSGHDLPVDVDTSWLYTATTNGANGSILRTVKTTNNPDAAAPLIPGLGFPTGMALDVPTNTIYWTDIGSTPGLVGKAPLDGGAKQWIDQTQPDPWGVAVNSSFVFYANQGAVDSNSNVVSLSGSIWRAPK